MNEHLDPTANHLSPEELDIETIMQIAFVATLAEACSGRWDNPFIAFSVYWFVTATDIKIQI